jgi:hypothetical protein
VIVVVGFVRSESARGNLLSHGYCPVYSPFVKAEDDAEYPWEDYQQVPPRRAAPVTNRGRNPFVDHVAILPSVIFDVPSGLQNPLVVCSTVSLATSNPSPSWEFTKAGYATSFP